MNLCSSQTHRIYVLSIYFIVAFCSPILLQAQSALIWSKTLGGSANELNVSSVQAFDDGYLLTSATNSTDVDVSSNHGNYDIWLAKLDEEGELVWNKSYGGSEHDYPSAICTTQDSNYLIAGHTYSNDGDISMNHGKGDAWIIKLNATGEIIWQKTFGGTNFDAANAITSTQDGGCIVAGFTYSADLQGMGKTFGGADYWVLKLNALGEIEWQKMYGGNKMDIAYSVLQTTDGNFVVAGNSLSFPANDNPASGLTDCWVLKLDPAGEIIWAESFGGFAANKTPAIIETMDGGFALTGNYPVLDLSNDNGQKYYENFWLVKLTNEGSQAWQKNYGGKEYDIANALSQTPDGGYLLAGYSWSANTFVTGQEGMADLYVLKINAAGELEWHQNYGGAGYDEANHIFINKAGDYLVSGISRSMDEDVPNNAGGQDIWVMKLAGPFQLNVDLGEDLAVCPNEAVELNAYLEGCNNCTYLWNDNNADSVRWINPMTTVSYTVTITDANGNTSSDDLKITVKDQISLNSNITQPSCANFDDGLIEIEITNSEGFSYAWSNNVTTQDNSMLSAGEYTLVVTDNNNCKTTEIFEVSAPDEIIISHMIYPISCFDAHDAAISIEVMGGVGAYTYAWSNGMTEQNPTGLSAGDYTLFLTDENDCLQELDIVLTAPAPLEAEVNFEHPTGANDNGSISINQITGGTKPYSLTVEQDGFILTAPYVSLAAGNYLVRIIDEHNCLYEEKIILDFTESTNTFKVLEDFNIYPNPTTGIFAIELSFSRPQAFDLQVYNSSGQLLLIQPYDAISQAKIHQNLTGLSRGTYFIVIQNEEGKSSRRLVVQ